jgi:hypothetical protein
VAAHDLDHVGVVDVAGGRDPVDGQRDVGVGGGGLLGGARHDLGVRQRGVALQVDDHPGVERVDDGGDPGRAGLELGVRHQDAPAEGLDGRDDLGIVGQDGDGADVGADRDLVRALHERRAVQVGQDLARQPGGLQARGDDDGGDLGHGRRP